jgi:tRNA pseudouridine32 synthase / 23S rRNA pseudouridine746 synthase
MPDGVPVLFSDDALIVVDKPAGLPAVPGRGAHLQDCVALRVQALYADALVVHRLDQATSGLMLLARGAAAQRAVSRMFEQRQVGKRYVAVVNGMVENDAGSIALPLAADWPQRPRQRVDASAGKASLTHWRVLARDPATQTTRLELEPLTGRTHQLRVHLLAIGHAIVGDGLYAPARPAPRLLLHASALSLAHPGDRRALNFSSTVPF